MTFQVKTASSPWSKAYKAEIASQLENAMTHQKEAQKRAAMYEARIQSLEFQLKESTTAAIRWEVVKDTFEKWAIKRGRSDLKTTVKTVVKVFTPKSVDFPLPLSVLNR